MKLVIRAAGVASIQPFEKHSRLFVAVGRLRIQREIDQP